MKVLVSLYVVTLVIKSQAGISDPCMIHKEIENYQRSTGFVLPLDLKSNLTYICDDNIKEGWYRFTSVAGGVMPTKCPIENACGTRQPIWLRGSHPVDVGEKKRLTACVRVKSTCCKYQWNIDVKKCSKMSSSFFVYKLLDAPRCPMAYCAGSEKKCGANEVSPTGFTPNCTRMFPQITKSPVVSVDVTTNQLRFKCKIDPEERKDNVRYEVTWFQGVPKTQIKKDNLSVTLTEAYLQNGKSKDKQLFYLGQEIFCVVRSYYEDTPLLMSLPYTSNFFFAGIKISPKEIVAPEKGASKKLRLTSTVPIVCSFGGNNCELLINIGQKNKNSINYNNVEVFTSSCLLSFKPGQAGQTKELELTAKRDFKDDGDQTMFLNVSISFNGAINDWRNYITIPDFKVKIPHINTGICTSVGDPHITTFDELYYHHYAIGDYILVNSTSRNFQVHVRTRQCASVSCNCAVAIKEGDDVIVIDMCRDNIPVARFASTVEPGATIRRNAIGNGYVVNFRSGAVVRYTIFPWSGTYFANIEVQVPSDDFQNTVGLCGTLDRNKNNEMMTKNGRIVISKDEMIAPTVFSENWKIPAGESLFYYQGGERRCLATRTKQYCTCTQKNEKQEVNCSFNTYIEKPKYIYDGKGYKTLMFPGAEACGRRKRRTLDQETILLPDDANTNIYVYDPPPFTFNEKKFPTTTGKTEESAKKICNETIRNSLMGKSCIDTIKHFNIQSFIDQCVVDVRILDEYSAATKSAINAMISTCEEKTLREITIYWKQDANGNLAPPQEIGKSLCPNDCSGNGICLNATCICNSSFITADCSIKKGQTPTLESVPNDGLCDVRQQDCIRIRVNGNTFIDSDQLSCKMIESKVYERKSPEKTGFEINAQGQLLSFRQVSCVLPNVPLMLDGNPSKSSSIPAKAFYIKVSNDGNNFSPQEGLIIIYDSKCMECSKNETRKCNLKINSCKINGYCFAKDDEDPNDWCRVCDPKRSKERFVQRLDNAPPMFSAPPTQYIFEEQKWKYKLLAKDPESFPLKYAFVGDNYGMNVSSYGIITWFPIELKVYKFAINVQDLCGLNTTKQFAVEVKACPCQNGGICKWNTPDQPENGVACVCPDGCMGERCTEPVAGKICYAKKRTRSHINGRSKTSTVALSVASAIIFIVVVATVAVLVRLKKCTSNEHDNVLLKSYSAKPGSSD